MGGRRSFWSVVQIDIWVLGLDPGSCHPRSEPITARMGAVCLTHLISHLPDVPVVLLVWIL